MLPPVWIEPGPLITFACKTETLGPLYSHALLIIAKSSQSLWAQKSSGAWTEV